MKSHRVEAESINQEATNLGTFLTTDMAMMCAYYSNLNMLKSNWKEQVSDNLGDAVTIEPSFLLINLIWERPGDGDWRLFINVPGNPIFAVLFFVLQKGLSFCIR